MEIHNQELGIWSESNNCQYIFKSENHFWQGSWHMLASKEFGISCVISTYAPQLYRTILYTNLAWKTMPQSSWQNFAGQVRVCTLQLII